MKGYRKFKSLMLGIMGLAAWIKENGMMICDWCSLHKSQTGVEPMDDDDEYDDYEECL